MVAEGFLAHDAVAVALFDLDEEEDQKALKRLQSPFPKKTKNLIFQYGDITDADASDNTIHKVAEMLGRFNVLVCIAGIVNTTRAIDYTPEDFRKICDLNTIGFFSDSTSGWSVSRTLEIPATS